LKQIEIKRAVIMTSQWRRLFVLTASTICILTVPAFAEEKSGAVTIEEKGIILHPGTKISQSDAKALNEVLKKYDKSLYKIDIYRNGEKKKSRGQLSDVCLDRTVVAEVAQAEGNSNRTLQVIAATNPQRTPGSTVNPVQTPGSTVNPVQTPGSTVNPVQTTGSTVNPVRIPGSTTNPQQTPCAPDEKAAKELIERLKPILEKYSKK
jgi:hypothetical protein